MILDKVFCCMFLFDFFALDRVRITIKSLNTGVFDPQTSTGSRYVLAFNTFSCPPT